MEVLGREMREREESVRTFHFLIEKETKGEGQGSEERGTEGE